MRMSWRWSVVLVAGLPALSGFAQSDPLDTVDGVVVNAGVPVAGATVELVNRCEWMHGPADVHLHTTTGPDGRYRFTEVKPGGCFTVQVDDAKGSVVAETAQFEMASYNHHTVKPDLDISAGAPADKYTWLEDVSGAKAMDWVKAEDARSAKVLEADPHYAEFYAEALKMSEDPSRLPYPGLRGHDVYNFWQDAAHPHGILRKTVLSDYLTPDPQWTTVIDFDALGQKDGVKWVNKGMSCLYPGDRYCMVNLSAGGEDADTQREFNIKTGEFVADGFTLPHSKQTLTG